MLKFVFACLIGSFAVASVLADENIVNEGEDLGGRQLGLPNLPSLPSQLPGIRPPALPSLNNPILQDISGAWLPTFVRTGLSCYSCEGKDAGSCIDFFSADDSITCQSNEYCAVTRTEQKGTLRIWRGCLSLSGVRTSLQGNTRHNEINEEGNKKYTQFCQTNLCNTGNGLLKCYSCEGTGSDSACMKKNPSKTDVTCGPNQYCSVVRTTLTPVVDNSATVASVAAPVAATDAKQTKNSEATYSITRKCENHYHNRWSNSIEYPYSVNLTPGRYEVAYACSTDFCNAVDGQELSPFQNANDVSRSPWSNPTFIGYATFLSDPRSTSISRNGSRIYFKDIRKRVKA